MALNKTCEAGAAGMPSVAAEEALAQATLLNLLAKIVRRPLDPTSATIGFSALGVDSLALAEWVAEIEMHYRIRIDDKHFSRLGTVADAAMHVADLRRDLTS